MNEAVEKILKNINLKIYKPIYLLAGEEPYYIDLISDTIEKSVLTEEERPFNQTVLYGGDTTVTTVIESARRFPMMSNHQVIIVKEAQSIKKIEELGVYAESPMPSTILVINYKYKKVDKRTKLFKAIQTNGLLFESKKLRDYQLPAWIENYLKREGVTIDESAKQLITEYLGTDLSKVANELDKLIIALNGKEKRITADIIETNIGISKDFNIFELQKAIGEKSREKSFRIVNYFAANPKENPIQLTINSLFTYFSKILLYHSLGDKNRSNVAAELRVHPFFVKEYELAARKYSAKRAARVVNDLRVYDMKSKGVGNRSCDDGELLKELIYKIIN